MKGKGSIVAGKKSDPLTKQYHKYYEFSVYFFVIIFFVRNKLLYFYKRCTFVQAYVKASMRSLGHTDFYLVRPLVMTRYMHRLTTDMLGSGVG